MAEKDKEQVLLMIKRTTGSDPWLILDTTRDTDNVVQDNVYANSSDAEFNTDVLDFVSNELKFCAIFELNNISSFYLLLLFILVAVLAVLQWFILSELTLKI